MTTETKQALITGAPDRVESLTKRFAAAGVRQVTLAQLGAGTGLLDYYIQLGVVVPAQGETLVRRVHSFLSEGLLERFAIAERVIPLLADDAVVLLVAGNLHAEMDVPDDEQARLSLLRVLGHAMRADLAPRRIRIRVITSGRGDDEIADFALTGRKDPLAAAPVRPDDRASSRTYEDWRIQMMGLAQIEL